LSWAASLVIEHGYGRNTYDVNLVVRLALEVIMRAFDALGKVGYRPSVPITAEQFAESEQRRSLLENKRMQILNFLGDQHRETALGVFVTGPFDFAEELKVSEVREMMPGLTVRIVSLTTLFTMKKAAGRPKDLADIDELSLLHELPSSYDKTD